MASPFEGDLDLPYFQATFPEVSHVGYVCSVLVPVGSKRVVSKLMLIGPFLLLEAASWPLVYLPNYFIRCSADDRLVDLIPVSPCLKVGLHFYTESREVHTDLAWKLIEARNSIDHLPGETVPFIYACEKYDATVGEFVPLESLTIRGNEVLLKGVDRRETVMVLDSETRMTTEGDIVNQLRCFSIWATPTSATTFRMPSLDAVLCSALAVAIPLIQFRRMVDLNQTLADSSCMSPEFPIEAVRMVSITKPVFQSPWSGTMNAGIGGFSEPDFRVTTDVPSVASDKLTIVSIGGGSERTVLIRNDPDSFESPRPLIMIVDKETDDECEDGLLKMGEGWPSIVGLPLVDEPGFAFTCESDQNYFSMSGNRLLDKCFQPPFITGEMESDIKRIGLKFQMVHVVPYGQDIVESLDSLIRSVAKQTADMGSKVFREVVYRIASILIDGADHSKIKQDLEVIATSMPSPIDVIPRNSLGAFDFVLTLTSRLIECHKLRCFINTILNCDTVRKHLYSDSALMSVPQFIANLISSVHQLERCQFTGRPPQFPSTLLPIKLAHCQISFLISRDVDMIHRLAQGRDPKLYETQICTLLQHLWEFLRDGFMLHTRESLWKLFQLVDGLQIRDPALSLFKAIIKQTESSTHSQWFLIPSCLLQGIRGSICHLWILFLACASHQNKAHDRDAPINNHDAVAMISEALKSLSTIQVSTELSALHYYAHMF